jgi:hypothetical protein
VAPCFPGLFPGPGGESNLIFAVKRERRVNAAIQNSKKITVQPKNGQRYGLVMQYKTVPAAV